MSDGRRHLEEEDSAIMHTNDEATLGKRAAVRLGYYQDPFVEIFAGPHQSAALSSPLMNRGHFARSLAFQTVALRFLGLSAAPDCPRRQIVSLGCGFDTLYFRLASQHGPLLDCLQSFRYFEVDFPQVVAKKSAAMNRVAPDLFQPHLEDGARYSLFACDLRNTQELTTLLLQHGFHLDEPTLFLSECVLIYMSPEEGSAIIEWAAKTVPHSVFCTYEQINPNDAFGKTMIRNLESRNIPLHSLMAYPTLQSQMKRYKDAGFSWARARTMINVYEMFLPAEETARANQIERFDEYEEWRLVLSHYMVVVAGNDKTAEEAINL